MDMPVGPGLSDSEEEIPVHDISDEDWLWCRECQRFFQVKDLSRDSVGGHQGCAFDDCGGEGLGYDLVEWDSVVKSSPAVREQWPKSVEELSKGLKLAVR